MPTYEYRCNACKHEFELFQSMTEGAKRKCPACGELKLERLIGTGAGFIFKGDGFYLTDYRSDSYKKAVEAEKKDSPGGEKKDSTTAEKKDSPSAEKKPDKKKDASKKKAS
jgi:putative FmdB family regulatory protein